MPSSYFLMIISWEQLLLGLKVNVDSIPVLYHSYKNIIHVKIFVDFIVHKSFLPMKYVQNMVCMSFSSAVHT